MAVASAVRPRTSAPLLVAAVLGVLLPGGRNFAGLQATKRPVRGARLVAHVGAGYLERNRAKASDLSFDPQATATQRVEVEFKQRPFGILRYQPGKDGKGAMAMEVVPEARYPGDPLGQASAGGVKAGMVVTGVNGIDMRSVDFPKIMDLLDDEVVDVQYRPHEATNNVQAVLNGKKPMSVELPATMWFAEIPGYQYNGGQLVLDAKEGWVLKDSKVEKAASMLEKLTGQQLQKIRKLINPKVLSQLETYAKQRQL